jgi:hypothetical protein
VKRTSAPAPRPTSLRRKVLVKLQQKVEKTGITQQRLVQEISPSASITEREKPLGDFVKSSRGFLTPTRAYGADDDESRYLMGTLT